MIVSDQYNFDFMHNIKKLLFYIPVGLIHFSSVNGAEMPDWWYNIIYQSDLCVTGAVTSKIESSKIQQETCVSEKVKLRVNKILQSSLIPLSIGSLVSIQDNKLVINQKELIIQNQEKMLKLDSDSNRILLQKNFFDIDKEYIFVLEYIKSEETNFIGFRILDIIPLKDYKLAMKALQIRKEIETRLIEIEFNK